MFYTADELKALEATKLALANRHVYRSPRSQSWTQDEILSVMKHNVCLIPVDAARYASQGHYKVAAAMLRCAVESLEFIQGLEDGSLEYRAPHFYKTSTGEQVT